MKEKELYNLPRFVPADGAFDPTWASLNQYECPEWLRDAKFGIWSHWDPQSVPERGDWYARNMYMQGSRQYEYHVKTYGHPSEFGYKDPCRLWTCEKWEPERLMDLYVRAGARYFVSLANHHDNFDCWNSRYQPWNAVNVGPKKDVVGIWAKLAREHGLRFGVTVHMTPGRTWSQFMPRYHACDTEGPRKAIRYDGRLTKEDGKGQWWEGMDPRMLYGPPHTAQDLPDPGFVRQFLWRVDDLIRQYDVDLLYFDDALMWLVDVSVYLGIPDLAPQIAAHYYNLSIARHGSNQAVLTIKDVYDRSAKPVVRDFEMTRCEKLEPYPWQTDTSNGEWHYNVTQKYRGATDIIHEVVDVVSKNGSVLINVPLHADGSVDPQPVECLEGIGKWMNLNGESIYGTRPWHVHGQGSERFTTNGEVLYVTTLSWPERGELAVKALGRGEWGGNIRQVTLLGHGPVPFERDGARLLMKIPEKRPCEHAWVLKIEGSWLTRVMP
jgi:alpha-L-fucosidase